MSDETQTTPDAAEDAAEAVSIEITPKAQQMIGAIMEQEGRTGDGLRVTARRGGPTGVNYGLAFVTEDEIEEEDEILEIEGIRVVVDPLSAPLLVGAKVDYIEGQWESGFKIDGPKPPEPKLEGPVAEAVQKVIEEKINPNIASHGGWVSLIDVQDDTAYIRLGGGCQGCGMVDVTLKQGIEVMIKEEVPEIAHILDTTDHAAGKNPYYQPAKG